MRGYEMNRLLTFVGSFGLGAATIYLSDPELGRRRRKLLADKAVHLGHRLGDGMEGISRDLPNRSQGLIAELRARTDGGPVSDAVLVNRVRSKIGRAIDHPGAIEVQAQEGRVTLSGPVLRDEVDDLLACVRSVPGVVGVEDRLMVMDQPGNIPALQGGGDRRSRGLGPAQENWSPTTRLLMGTGGALLLMLGLSRRGLLMLPAIGAGGALLLRGLTNTPMRRLTGICAGRRSIDFHKTITVNAPIDEVYEFWSQQENFPRFMAHVREVTVREDGSAHWVVAGPAGVPIAFDTVITSRTPNRVLAWKTTPGWAVQHSGIIQFEPAGDNATRMDIRMSYNPPAGAAGHALASLFGIDPLSAMDEDLVRFKSLMEQGKTSAPGKRVTKEALAPRSRARRSAGSETATGLDESAINQGVSPEG
jgi:uncharacterized membrane protein